MFVFKSCERRILSCGKLEKFYISSFSPNRVPEDLSRFELCLAVFDSESDLEFSAAQESQNSKDFNRTTRFAFAVRQQCPVIFCCAQKPRQYQVCNRFLCV
jgi:hypothetical protein